MRPFEYLAPETISSAVMLLNQYEDKAKIIAGGTDLLVEIKENLRHPEYIVDLNRIGGLAELTYNDQTGLKIGCLTKMRSVELSPLVKEKYPSLQQAASQVGSLEVRNLATVAGNICRASPSADTIPALIAAGAFACVQGIEGERKILLEDFFIGPGQTVLEAHDILTGIIIPPPPNNNGQVYLKHGRRKSMELATVGIAVSIALDGEICRDIRIAMGAVSATPKRAKKAEMILRNHPLSRHRIKGAAAAAKEEATPISDVRATAEYRKEIVEVLTIQALEQAIEMVRNDDKAI